MNSKITFISNNVKGIQNSVKKVVWIFKKLCDCKWVCSSTGNAFLYKQWIHVERWVQQKAFFSPMKKNKLMWSAAAFYRSKTIEQINKISDKSGRILLFEATINYMVLILINIYNTNTKLEQLGTFRFSKYFRQSKRYSK